MQVSQEAAYTAAIVELTANGYKIYGYDIPFTLTHSNQNRCYLVRVGGTDIRVEYKNGPIS